jgi:hypothetical protein
MYLEEHGAAPVGFTVPLAPQPATERFGVEHEFRPEARIPELAI